MAPLDSPHLAGKTMSLMSTWDPEFLESQYSRWRRDAASLSEDWRHFFEGFELAGAFQSEGGNALQAHKQSAVNQLIQHYRMVGHFIAAIDVLGDNPSTHPLLELSNFGLSESDLEVVFDASALFPPQRGTLREIIGVLRETYCSSVGVECMHILNTRERRWIQERIESIRMKPAWGSGSRRRFLQMLRFGEGFEKYLHRKYVGQKRFSLEGGESLIVALDTVAEHGADAHALVDVVIGMAHRGRLNVLANVMEKSYELIFSEFEANYIPDSLQGDGDVKYHKGFSSDRYSEAGNKVHLTLTANPSHLEAVDPVVEGRVRAKQAIMTRRGQAVDPTAAGIEPEFPSTAARRKVLPVLVHGDAAFTGQGVVWETLNLSQLDGYKTGGTIHIIVNNRIGFTTSPRDARSTPYCTDVARGIDAPVFHVNGDDPEAVAFITRLAVDFRQEFGKDVVIDLNCFRRWGHNEGDEPSFTQPMMYKKIAAHPGVASKYAHALVERGVMTREEVEDLDQKILERLAHAQEGGRLATETDVQAMTEGQAFAGEWSRLQPRYSHAPVETGVPADQLRLLASRLAVIPEDFQAHPKIQKLAEARRAAVMENGQVDWGTAEALAFASLLIDGTPIRLSGQDSRRGTFSHRQAVYHDTRDDRRYTPLRHLEPRQAVFEVYDSLLSEAAVLGFEYGVSMGDPQALVLWEAQFGDFANGAQVAIDQFIASGETKWQRSSGIVLLLPHGYEGQGPEHSSARLERFLQLCADDNLQVCNLTTPGQYFHVLRRQVRRDFRKPLVIMTPKGLLRHPAAQSPVEELSTGRFREVLGDPVVKPGEALRLLLCSGKVYLDLLDGRRAAGRDDVAIVRVEQLHPFPAAQLKEALEGHGAVREVAWVQEEPRNMGAWSFVEPRLMELLGRRVEYIGRPAAASPAAGSKRRHDVEQKALVDAALQQELLSPEPTSRSVSS